LDAGHGRTYKLLLAVEYDLNLNSHLLSAEVHRTRSPRSAVGALSAAPLPSLTGISLCDVCFCHKILPPPQTSVTCRRELPQLRPAQLTPRPTDAPPRPGVVLRTEDVRRLRHTAGLLSLAAVGFHIPAAAPSHSVNFSAQLQPGSAWLGGGAPCVESPHCPRGGGLDQVRRPSRPAICCFDWDLPVRRLFLSRNIEGAPASPHRRAGRG
jgi:hypothetical protein